MPLQALSRNFIPFLNFKLFTSALIIGLTQRQLFFTYFFMGEFYTHTCSKKTDLLPTYHGPANTAKGDTRVLAVPGYGRQNPLSKCRA